MFKKAQYEKLKKYFNIIKQIPFLQDKNDESIKRWLTYTLNLIRKKVNATSIGYAYPKFNIFANVAKNETYTFFEHSLSPKTQKMLIYALFVKNVQGPCVFKSDYCLTNDLVKSLAIKKILFVPMIKDFSAKSILAYGFKKDNIEFDDDEILFLSLLNENITNQIDSAKEFSLINSQLTNFEEQFVNTLVFTIEARDPYTKGHSQRVAYYALKIADELLLDADFKNKLYISGLLHDIGKIGIPDNVLLKPARLSKNEFEVIKHHSIFSYDIVKSIKSISDFEQVSLTIRQHHERLDGTGYPDGAKGDDICFGARILAIADSFDALTTTRPYRKSFNPSEAIDIMLAEKGHFDLKILFKAESILKNSYLSEKDATENMIVPKSFEEYRNKFADTDIFTGLFNRSALIKHLREAIEKKKKFALFMLDIKDLSTINMLEGSEVGDEIILFSAQLIKNISQNIKQLNGIELDIVAPSRLGGDSFMFISMLKNNRDLHILKDYLKSLDKVLKNYFTKPLTIDPSYNIVNVFYPEDGFSAEELIYRCTRKKKNGEMIDG